MTAPRQILPGACYLITRRCTQRQYLLAPSDTTNNVLLYILGVAAERFGIRVHVYCAMSNHIHLLATDPGARLPKFLQYFDGLVARAMNAYLGRWESFWAPDTYSAVRLETPSDIIDKAAYILANPVAAGLVRTGRLWPGAWSEPDRIGTRPLVLNRPTHFFAEDGAMPSEVQLELTVPPGFTSAEEFTRPLTEAYAEREREAAKRVGGNFVGVAKVLKQKPTSRPASVEPRRTLSPRVAARDTQTRVAMLARLSAFVRAYREARRRWCAGEDRVEFPAGTYQLRVMYGVRCAGAG